MSDQPTIDAYDKYAHVYDDEVIDFWKNFPPEFLDKFAEATPGKRILNVGSGSGRDALLLIARRFEVVCADASRSMIDITQGLGFESHLAEFSELDFPAGSFDGIWAYTSLIHIPKSEAQTVILQLRKLLKPGGTFAIGVIQGDEAGMVNRASMPGTARYFKNYMPEELQKMIELLGFKLVFQNTYTPGSKVYINQLYQI